MSSEVSPFVQEAIELFRVFMKSKIVFTGRMKNANKLARILPLYFKQVTGNFEAPPGRKTLEPPR